MREEERGRERVGERRKRAEEKKAREQGARKREMNCDGCRERRMKGRGRE